MTLEETRTALMAVRSVFTALDVTPPLIRIWHGILSQVPFDEVQNAIMIFLKSDSEFPPKPGQIYQIVEKARRVVTEQLTAGEAWDVCVAAAAKSLEFSDFAGLHQDQPKMVKAARQVSWHRIRYADFNELDFVRNTFIDFYNSMEVRDDEQILLTHKMSPEVKGLVSSTLKNLKLIGGEK